MPPVLSIVSSDLSGMKRRKGKTKRYNIKGLGCPPLRSRLRLPRLGFGNVFHCATNRKNVDNATHHHLSKNIIERHRRINKIMDRFGIKKLKFRPTIKRKKKSSKEKSHKVNLRGLLDFGNLMGVIKMAKKRKGCAKKKSLGRRIACKKKIPKGRCRKVGRRIVCRKKKAFIRSDVVSRKHSPSGRFLPMSGIGLGNFGAFRGDSCAHRVARAGYGGWRKPQRRRHHRGGRGGLGSFGFGAITVPSSIKSFLPPINKEIVLKSLTIISGAVAPITIQNMIVPVKWRTGILGMLTYTLSGLIVIGVSGKVAFLRPKQADLGLGVVIGLGYQIIQNYILKRSLIPVANAKAPTALKGVDACASCQNAGDCADVGDCLGYTDGVNDELLDELDNDLEGDLEDELLDELDDGLEGDLEDELLGDYVVIND